MNTAAPTPVQVDEMVRRYFIAAMEERYAAGYSDKIAWKVRKQEAARELRTAALEHGQLFPGRRELRGELTNFTVDVPAPHALRLAFNHHDEF